MKQAKRRFWRYVLGLWLALALTLAGVSQSSSLRAEQPNGAGLVIRFGDGQVITAYVTFTEPAITGIDLLQRAGIPVTVAPFGGLGLAVCAIAGQGCPAEDCFCQAKRQPAWFWHYYGLTDDGRWVLHSVGASTRLLRDGDVDGWSWTSGESGLPPLTIEQLAQVHGFERAASSTTLTAPPSPTLGSAPPSSEVSGTPASQPPAEQSPRTMTTTPFTPTLTATALLEESPAIWVETRTVTPANAVPRAVTTEISQTERAPHTASVVSATPSGEDSMVHSPTAVPPRATVDEGQPTWIALVFLGVVLLLISYLTIVRHRRTQR